MQEGNSATTNYEMGSRIQTKSQMDDAHNLPSSTNRRLHSPPGYSYPIDIQASINSRPNYIKENDPLNYEDTSHYTTPHQSGIPPLNISVANAQHTLPSNHYSQPTQLTHVPVQHASSYQYAQPSQSQQHGTYHYSHPHQSQQHNKSNPPSRSHTPTSLQQYQQPRNQHQQQYQQPLHPPQPNQHPLSVPNNYGSQNTLESPSNMPRDPSGRKYALLQFNGPIVGQEIDV